MGWNFTKADFDTPMPYQYLYEQRGENVFVYNLMVRKMAAYAAEIGFRGFATMYKNFCLAMKNTTIESMDMYGNATSFTKQPLELDAGR
jgi:hypothetical protein